MAMTLEQKAQRKMEREAAKAERLAELKTKLTVGAFMVRISGATMRRAQFFEVVEIKKNQVLLRPATVEVVGDVCSGYRTLTGPGQGEATVTAKIRAGVVSIGSHYWDQLSFATIGQREYEHSD